MGKIIRKVQLMEKKKPKKVAKVLCVVPLLYYI